MSDNIVTADRIASVIDKDGNLVSGVTVIVATTMVNGEALASAVFGSMSAASEWGAIEEARLSDEYHDGEVDVEFITDTLVFG